MRAAALFSNRSIAVRSESTEPVKILAALDKFKDSMTAETACEAVGRAVTGVFGPDAEFLSAPLTDGGEGFARILALAAGGQLQQTTVRDPRGAEAVASIGWVPVERLPAGVRSALRLESGRLAVLEMASAAGLEQVPRGARHPADCSTHGVGDLILRAVKDGASAILLGIGGSATSDLGLGALETLGLRFHDAGGEPVSLLFPRDWPRVRSITGPVSLRLPPLFVACDVDNPLLGPKGAAAVYGPQKGLHTEEVEAYDRESDRIADLLLEALGRPATLKQTPGSGAAGGMGFGLMAACGAELVAGFPLVTDWLRLPEKMASAEVLITGEGKFDLSSLSGKGPYALLERGAVSGKTVVLLAGALGEPAVTEIRRRFPDVQIKAISPSGIPLEQALREGPENLYQTATRCLRDLDRGVS